MLFRVKSVAEFKNYIAYGVGEVVNVRTNRVLKQEHTKNGYLRVTLSKNGKTKRFLVHRLVAILFIANPYKKPQVNHKDGNKKNNHYQNLEWVTSKENVSHCIESGLQVLVGSKNPCAKLTNTKVLAIRKNKKDSWSVMAKRYNVSKTLIGMVVNKKIWKHLL